MNLLPMMIAIVAMFAVTLKTTYTIGKDTGLEEGMELCSKAAQLISGESIFAGCFEENGNKFVSIPSGEAGTYTETRTGGTIQMQYKVPLSRWNLITGEKVRGI
jgi:hypothetical protein